MIYVDLDQEEYVPSYDMHVDLDQEEYVPSYDMR